MVFVGEHILLLTKSEIQHHHQNAAPPKKNQNAAIAHSARQARCSLVFYLSLDVATPLLGNNKNASFKKKLQKKW